MLRSFVVALGGTLVSTSKGSINQVFLLLNQAKFSNSIFSNQVLCLGSLCVCACVCACVRACMCVCMCACTRAQTNTVYVLIFVG